MGIKIVEPREGYMGKMSVKSAVPMVVEALDIIKVMEKFSEEIEQAEESMDIAILISDVIDDTIGNWGRDSVLRNQFILALYPKGSYSIADAFFKSMLSFKTFIDEILLTPPEILISKKKELLSRSLTILDYILLLTNKLFSIMEMYRSSILEEEILVSKVLQTALGAKLEYNLFYFGNLFIERKPIFSVIETKEEYRALIDEASDKEEMEIFLADVFSVISLEHLIKLRNGEVTISQLREVYN